MVEELADVARRSNDSNPYTGDLQARTFRKLVAMPSYSGGPRRRWVLLRELGHHELRLGNDAVAIARFREAWEMVPHLEPPLRAEDVDRNQLDLAIAYLRWGESQNCIAHHTAESCIAPISPAGVHQDQEGARHAIAELTELLRRHPEHLAARWLLNIAYMTIGGYPQDVPPPLLVPPSVFASDEAFPRFADVAPSLGLSAPDLGGGVAVDDFDGDGRLDLVVSSSDPSRDLRYHAGGPEGFRDRSADAGFTGLTGGNDLVPMDYDGDGDVDLLVLRGAWLGREGRVPKSLLRNDGKGVFTDVTLDAGLGDATYPSQTAAWADYDGDGDLDLYVGNEWSENSRFPSQLFQNRGDGTFVDVAARAGVENRRLAKGVAWGDFDGDGRPDLYVSNLNGDNRLYRSRGDGTFEDVAAAAGVNKPWSGLGVIVWDFDNDGVLDIYAAATSPRHGTEVIGNRTDETAPLAAAVGSALGETPRGDIGHLYRGLGGGRFEDVTRAQGLERVILTGGIASGDLDLDGFPDLYLGTSYPGFEGLLPNKLFRNRGGSGFADVTTAAGVGHLQKAAAIAIADLDADGDEDIFVNAGGMYRGDVFGDVLFANPGNGNHWIDVKLVGKGGNRAGVGAHVRLQISENGGTRSVHRFAGSGSSFGSNPAAMRIGLDRATKVEVLEVSWPGSTTPQVLRDLGVDRVLEVRQP